MMKGASLLLGALLLATIPSQGSAPLCSSVLLAVQSSAQSTKLQRSIVELAQLKLNLDIAQSSGQQTSMSKMLVKQYPIRFQQVLKGAEGISENELKHRVSEQIRVLQGGKKKEQVQEKEIREETNVLKVSYQMKSERALPFTLTAQNQFFEYLPNQEIIVGRALLIAPIFGTKAGASGTILFDLRTNQPVMIQENSILAEILPDGRTLISMNQEGKLLFYDLESRQDIKTIQANINQEKSQAGWGINHDGSLLAFNSLRDLVVIETATGKEISRFTDFFNAPHHAKKIKFLNENELFIHASGLGLFKYDIANQSREELVKGDFKIAITNHDNSQVVLGTFRTDNVPLMLVNLADNTKKEIISHNIDLAREIGNTGHYFIKTSKDKKNQYGIYTFAGEVPLQDLTGNKVETTNAMSGIEVRLATATKDGKQIVLLRQAANDLTRSTIEFYEK